MCGVLVSQNNLRGAISPKFAVDITTGSPPLFFNFYFFRKAFFKNALANLKIIIALPDLFDHAVRASAAVLHPSDTAKRASAGAASFS